MNLEYIVDPIMGTLIGFGTNYIAVKMLFRPYKPIKIGNFTLPFTPGVIPKRRELLAESLGKIISNELFTNNDIKQIFLSDEVKEKVIDEILKQILDNDSTIKELIIKNTSDEKFNDIKDKSEKYISKKLVDGLIEMKVGKIISEAGAKAIKEKVSGSLFGKFISEDFIVSVTDKAGENVEETLKKSGEEKILPIISKETDKVLNYKISEIKEKNELTDEKLKSVIEDAYVKIVNEKMQNIFEIFDISNVVKEKVNEMDVKKIEELFMKVMKKELNAIVYLGGILGLLLGIINIFI